MGIRQSEINKSQGNNQTHHTKLKASEKYSQVVYVMWNCGKEVKKQYFI